MKAALTVVMAMALCGCAKKPRPETLHEPVMVGDAGHAARPAPTPDAAAPKTLSKEPDEHRPQAFDCEPFTGKGNAAPGVAGCHSDAECKNGPGHLKGRCINHPGGHDMPRNACQWDGCYANTDCGKGGVCACGGGGYNSDIQNVCLKGNCTVDADCGAGGFCSPSRNDQQSCFGAGPVGYFCHTAKDSKDECVKREDCASPTDCVFSPSAGHWQCKDIYSMCPVG